jgi:hypothetical protein
VDTYIKCAKKIQEIAKDGAANKQLRISQGDDKLLQNKTPPPIQMCGEDKRRSRVRYTSPTREHPDRRYEPFAMMCIATNRRTGDKYIGFSGTAGGMARGLHIIRTEQSERRYSRISYTMSRVIQSENRRPENCAEAAAYSIAVSYGERLEDLVFQAIDRYGHNVPPCRNCQQWVPRRR